MSSELLPCPFCGEKAKIIVIEKGVKSILTCETPHCSFSRVSWNNGDTDENARKRLISAWNTRTQPPADVKEVVPCGQCKSCIAGETVYDMYCEELERSCYTIGFCGLGERKAVE